MSDILISADSHVIEDPHLWEKRLPAQLRDAAPVFPELGVGGPFQAQPGGNDPAFRVKEMSEDGVVQEVLYPSFAMDLFGLADSRLQENCFSVYNDWISEYCAVAPDKLFGVAVISTFNIDNAVKELERCKSLGLRGAMLWEVPPEEFSFSTSHYDPLWELAEAYEMPISLHILTGEPYRWPQAPKNRDQYYNMVTVARRNSTMVLYNANAVSDLIMSGVVERFPNLKFILVETEASWIPYFLMRWDRSSERPVIKSQLTMAPSQYFERNFFVTFFNDPVLSSILTSWGTRNCMWSNDYPHPNSTWPKSSEVIQRDLGHLPAADRDRLVRGNVAELYNLPALAGMH